MGVRVVWRAAGGRRRQLEISRFVVGPVVPQEARYPELTNTIL